MDKEHKNSDLEKIDIQVVSVEPCDIDDAKKSFASLAEKEDLSLDPDLMYVRFIMCHEGSNANGDTFTNDVLYRARFTPRFKPINWEHGEPMIGHILDSRYGEDAQGRGYIEAVGVVWKFIFPELADSIKSKAMTGELRLSMECYFKDSNYKYGEQIFDQEQAEELGISDYVGRSYMGQKVYRVFKDVIFGGVGVVENPADKEAVFLSVAKKHVERINEEDEVEYNLTEEQMNAIANIIRNTNDFNEKKLNKETIDALTVAKFVKVFDKAKSDIVNRFNAENIATKEQLATEVRSIVEKLLSDVSNINNDFYTGLASEELDEQEEGGSEEMEDNQNLETVVEEVVEPTVVEEVEEVEVVENVEEVVEDNVDYQAKATKLEGEVANLKDELHNKQLEFENLKNDFDALRNKVEASEKEALVSTRMKELEDLGVEFSEARKAKEIEKVSAMDNDSFADYKDFLSELLGNKEEVEVVEASEEVVEEVVEETVEVEIETSTASALNIETEIPKVITPFGHLSE